MALSEEAKSTERGVLELRALRVLRRVGTRGMFHEQLKRRMRPSHGTMLILNAIRALERLKLIEYHRAGGAHTRVQGAWRITDSGRDAVDAADLPPAA